MAEPVLTSKKVEQKSKNRDVATSMESTDVTIETLTSF